MTNKLQKNIRPYFSQKFLEILVYVVIWTLISFIPLSWAYNYQQQTWDLDAIYNWWIKLVPFFIIFLINIFWLIPRFLLRGNRRWLFFLLTTIFSVTILTLNPYASYKNVKLNEYIREQKRQEFIKLEQQKAPRLDKKDDEKQFKFYYDNAHKHRIPWWVFSLINDFIISFSAIGVTISIRLLFKSIKDQQIMSELRSQNTSAELEYLKHQINPHFLMNTLNNIHALIDICADEAKDSIIELSKIMRYVLYDTNVQTVSLSKEIQFIRNYIELMRMRYDNSVEIKINVPQNIPEVMIPPLLLQPFIENAFKHGISSIKKSFIYIDINVSDSQICCSVKNSNNHKHEDIGGIGLENVKKRLQLLFNDQYVLEINDAEIYTITLKIPINQ